MLDEAPSWGDWVMFEPRRDAFIAEENIRMAKRAEDSYRQALAYIDNSGALGTDEQTSDVTLLHDEAARRYNAASQLNFNASEWLLSRSNEDFRVWQYRYGHVIAVVEILPRYCK